MPSSSQSEDEDADADPPSPKRRRRLSASLPPVRDDVSIVSSIQDSPGERNDEDQDIPIPDAPETPGEGLRPVGEAPARAPPTHQQQQQQQPTFHAAPRFKPADAAAAAEGAAPHEPLPDVFSPRRRGEKFVPGGLAAGLRGWLMDLEAATGTKRDGEWAARVFVERVRAGGGGMRLVHGRCMRSGGDNVNDDGGSGGGRLEGEDDDNDNDDNNAPVRWTRLVLAGDGRLTGLARRNEVTVGAILGIAKPVWEVGLGREGRWVMACDWKVL